MSDLTESLTEHLPDDLDEKVTDSDHGEETAAKNYGVPILKELGLEHADYEEIIESGDRPDFLWEDKDGITRIVGEFKKPWDQDHSDANPRYKIEQAIEEARVYNDQLRLKYILATDGRYIFFSNEYADPPVELELDLLDVLNNPDDDDVERIAEQLQQRITGTYDGEWNDTPSQRDISDPDIFQEFIEASRAALNNDLLPSIERLFEVYEDQYEEFEEEKAEIEEEREELRERYREHIDWDLYKKAIDRVAENLQFDYEDHLSGAASGSLDEDRWIDEVAEFREELLGLRNQLSSKEAEYEEARRWHDKWQSWLILTGKDYESASKSDKDEIRETFQLQTLNTLYNRLLLIRTFEDMGIIGQVISNGFIKFYDEKVQLRDNKFLEPLSTASRQAEEVYSPLFRRDTPHDWYHYEEDVLKTVLRRFDNFNFREIDRDIFGEMYQQCLDAEKRKRLGAYYTPPTAVEFLLDYSSFTPHERNIKQRDEPVLDPACGSGTFVLAAMSRVIDALKDSGYDLTRDDDLLTAIDLINEKIRGFDVDPFAIQLAQSNLLIRVLQERRSAGDDAHLELPSFSTFDTDSLLTAKGSETTSIDRFYRAREDNAEDLDEIIEAKQDDYTWVIGNPPYVRAENQDQHRIDEYERLHDVFGEDQADIFTAFVEQGLDWLEPGGQLAFVVSNALLVTGPSEPAMKYIRDNATIDLVADLTRCKIFGIDVNTFPILIVLTKRAGDDNEDVRKENDTEVVKVYPKGSDETNEWGYALDHAAAELLEWRDEPDYDFETDFESDEYPDVTTADTYDRYTVSQNRFIEEWSDWADRLTLNFQIDDKLWEVAKEMEDSDECVSLNDLCKMDGGGRGGPVSRGEEPRFFRPYTNEEKTDDFDTPVVGGKNLEQFYLGDAPGDVEEYIDLDAIEADDDADVSSNKMEAFGKDKIAYRETAPELTFVVDAADEDPKFYNKTAYFLQLQNDGGLAEFSESSVALDPHYIAGLLNSNLLDFYYKAYYEHLSFRHAPAVRVRPSHLHHAPIKLPDDVTRETIADHSKTIHEAKREAKKLRHERETLFESFQEDGRTVSFRSKIRSVVDSRDFNIRTFTIEQNGTEVSLNRYYTVEMHSTHEAASLAEFLEKYGDEYIAGDKLRDLELPESLDVFADEHSDLDGAIDDLEDRIETEIDALNETVYELYGVAEHREEIEEYLDSFLTVIK
ncbi:Eco57I restriction-modification methylase domain-containing protein [Halorubrum ezzemoulense]|uniref:Eco57I restriction-modification methylase domain-containing protein n=1 Tax=Halorubrum ezzemoulense TaxID=337243 RepID=UPI00232D2BC5|nr:N-6 DNA methylase [Halorubrum ezzemoulense]MDB2243012.1 N-6 DNA methylase [Halorubrum ezzemoulense]